MNSSEEKSLVVETRVRPSPAPAVDSSGQEVTDERTLAVHVAMRRHADAVPAHAGLVGHRQEEQVAVLGVSVKTFFSFVSDGRAN